MKWMALKFRQFALLSIPLRAAMAQFGVGLLLLASVVVMVVAQHHADSFAALRLSVAAATRPIFAAVAQPAATLQDMMGQWQTAAVLQMENQAMREELSRLREWQSEAVRLNAENRALRALLATKQPHELASATGQVLSDSGASFASSIIVAVPPDFRLRRGLVAMTGEGMVGRTAEVQENSGLARVMLLDDPASRLPVAIGDSGVRAILAGQGGGVLMLEHLPPNATPQVGENLTTAGNDGLLPANLPVAKIIRVEGDRIFAAPLAPLDRLEWLRLVDFGTIDTLNKPNFHTP